MPGDYVHPLEIKNPVGPLDEHYFTDATDMNNIAASIVAKYTTRPPNSGKGGFYYACPSENPLTMTDQERDKLKIVRRFLPAEYFDVNISLECVVPLEKATSTGSKCYASGDENNSFYIQYYNSYNGSPGFDCGPGMNECPAYVSFFWRNK